MQMIKYLIHPIVLILAAFVLSENLASGPMIFATIASSALLVAALERLVPHYSQWNNNKGDLLGDTLHYFVNFGIKQAATMIYAILAMHMLSFPTNIWPTHWPAIVQVVLAGLIIDFCIYWVHRWSHEYDYLWLFHAIHHSSRRLYLLNGEKRHPVHQLIEGLPGITLALLLGAPAPIVIAYLALLNVNMMLQHGNADIRLGALRYLFAGAEVHRFHHRRDAEASSINYGALFAAWDVLFGTFYFDTTPALQEDAGIADEPGFPMSYLKQVAWPFRRLSRPNREMHNLPTESS